MEASRQAAIFKGETVYNGKVCAKDEEHGDERYTSNGGCVACAAERSAKQAKEKPKAKKAIMSEPEVHALLLRGGPDTKAMAQAAGLKWYNHPQGLRGACHAIVGIDGFCPLCGQETPEPVDVKEELDLAAQLLS